jgi:hypothetical protein
MKLIRNSLVIAGLAAALGGCNLSEKEIMRMATADTAAFCDIARPIYWSRKDTLETVKQVKAHNAVGKICGWSGK